MAWAPAYVEVEELRDFLRISDTDDDTELAWAIEAASRAIDQEANRQFGQVDVAEVRYYTARYDRTRCLWIVDIDDLVDVTGLTVAVYDPDDVSLGNATVVLEPRNAVAKSRAYTSLAVTQSSTYTPTGRRDEMAVTGLWGWPAVPDSIKQATLLQASRVFARRVSPFGIAGSPDVGSELRLLAKVDPDVAVAVKPYRRWWGAV